MENYDIQTIQDMLGQSAQLTLKRSISLKLGRKI